jgi:hypothetical protein
MGDHAIRVWENILAAIRPHSRFVAFDDSMNVAYKSHIFTNNLSVATFCSSYRLYPIVNIRYFICLLWHQSPHIVPQSRLRP